MIMKWNIKKKQARVRYYQVDLWQIVYMYYMYLLLNSKRINLI